MKKVTLIVNITPPFSGGCSFHETLHQSLSWKSATVLPESPIIPVTESLLQSIRSSREIGFCSSFSGEPVSSATSEFVRQWALRAAESKSEEAVKTNYPVVIVRQESGALSLPLMRWLKNKNLDVIPFICHFHLELAAVRMAVHMSKVQGRDEPVTASLKSIAEMTLDPEKCVLGRLFHHLDAEAQYLGRPITHFSSPGGFVEIIRERMMFSAESQNFLEDGGGSQEKPPIPSCDQLFGRQVLERGDAVRYEEDLEVARQIRPLVISRFPELFSMMSLGAKVTSYIDEQRK